VLIEYGLSANYQLVIDRINHTDTLEVRVELSPEMFSDTVRGVEGREKEISENIKKILGISAKVSLVAPKSMVRSEGKAIRVIDKRKI
jgi:phenylacetate-CoA ligase